MTDNEMILKDRIEKTQQVVAKYGEDNFSISFSGGKDSTVLSALVDLALPGNEIPRVYADTGIELNMVRDFVFQKAKNDKRFVIIKPRTPIKQMLEKEGYPFKSKLHSVTVNVYSRKGKTKGVAQYLCEHTDKAPWGTSHSCPKILKYQFEPNFNLKISDKCCDRLKKDPLNQWSKENDRPYYMIGLMREEGGRRNGAQCIAFKGGKFRAFQPLVQVTKEWEDWFINQYNVEICDIYKPPYNFKRTGCKGCPFASDLQNVLDVLEEFFPAERKQCEIIWKPVYDEYRRIGYRLKKTYDQMSMFDIISHEEEQRHE